MHSIPKSMLSFWEACLVKGQMTQRCGGSGRTDSESFELGAMVVGYRLTVSSRRVDTDRTENEEACRSYSDGRDPAWFESRRGIRTSVLNDVLNGRAGSRLEQFAQALFGIAINRPRLTRPLS